MKPANVHRRWTEAEDRILREQYATATVTELCTILRRSLRSVCGRITRLGLGKFSGHKWTELAWLRDNSGKVTHAEMASILGVTLKCVSRAIERYGFQKHRCGMTGVERSLYAALHAQGLSDLKISRRLGLTKSRVLRHRLRSRLPGNGYTEKSWSAPDPKFREEKRKARRAVATVQLQSLQRELEAACPTS